MPPHRFPPLIRHRSRRPLIAQDLATNDQRWNVLQIFLVNSGLDDKVYYNYI
jgi:hypothetical protein